MKVKIKSMKQELKELAQEIRTLKSKRKTHVSEYYKRVTGYVRGLQSAQYRFRVNHIAYCLLRGRKPEEIENRWRDPENIEHKMVWKKAEDIVKEVYKEFDIIGDKELVGYETIRSNSQ